MNGNGSRAHETVWQQHGRPRRRALKSLYLLAGSVVVVIGLAAFYYAVFGGVHLGGGWVTVGSLSDVKHHGIAFDRRVDVFIVADSDALIAFRAVSPHLGERVYYCETSGWFESADGVSKFDRHGFYREGPALRGLDRVAVRQEHGFVSVDPSQRAPGPPPTVTDGGQPLGQYCSGPNPSSVDPKTGRWVVPVVSGEQTTG